MERMSLQHMIPRAEHEGFDPQDNQRLQEDAIKSLVTVAEHERGTLSEVLKSKKANGEKHGRKAAARRSLDKISMLELTGGRMIQALEGINPSRISADPTNDALRKQLSVRSLMLESFYDGFYSAVENPGVAKDRITQILAEFATMQGLYDYLDPEGKSDHYGVYYSTAEEDLHHGIDAWVDTGENAIAIQTKCLHMPQKPSSYVVGLNFDPQSLEDRIVCNDRYKSATIFKSKDKRDHFIDRGKAMLTYCSQYDNVIPAYVIIPNLGDAESLDFYTPFGLPKEGLKKKLSEGIQPLLHARRP